MPYQDDRGWIHFTPAEQLYALIDLLGRAYNNRHKDEPVKGLATVQEVETAVKKLADALGGLGLGWALAGGLALGARARPRATFDVDLVVLTTDFEAVKRAVAKSWFDLSEERGEGTLGSWEGVRCQTLVGPFPSKVDVDIIFSDNEFFRSMLSRTSTEEILPDLQVPVISAEDLVLLKLKAARPPDLADAWRVFKDKRQAVDWPYLREWADKIGVHDRLREFESEFGAP